MQRTLSFTAVASGSTDPATALASADQELLTDYTSYLHLLMHLLPHLASQTDDSSSSRRTAIVLVSSGLALVPVPRCAGYCAAKAALHSLAWTLRAQLGSSDGTSHIKVIEIIPPAVQTELHSHQPDLVAIGQSKFGMPLDEFLEEAWAGLERGDEDIFIGGVREHFAQLEDPRRAAFHAMIEHMRNAGIKA